MISSNLEQKYKSIILTNFFSKLYEIRESHKNQFSRRIGRNHSSVVANIEEIYQRSLFFFSIVGFSIDIQLAVSSRPIYPRYDLNWIFSKASLSREFSPLRGIIAILIGSPRETLSLARVYSAEKSTPSG